MLTSCSTRRFFAGQEAWTLLSLGFFRSRAGPYDPVERNAKKLAACLLAPEKMVWKVARNTLPERLGEQTFVGSEELVAEVCTLLAKVFRMSKESMLYRIRNLSVLDWVMEEFGHRIKPLPRE